MVRLCAALLLLASTAAEVVNPIAVNPLDVGRDAALLIVDLKTAGDFTLLSRAGISNVPPSLITGDAGVSPIKVTAITGFVLSPVSIGTTVVTEISPTRQITGNVYAAGFAPPTPAKMIQAIDDMEAAYTDAAARLTSIDTADPARFLNVKAGLIGGETFTTGVYTWGTFVGIPAGKDITLQGSETDVFIFQLAGYLSVGAGSKVVLMNPVGVICDAPTVTNCPKASNIFWQVAEYVTTGASSHLEGVLLVKKTAAFAASATLNGRVLSQTSIALSMVTITAP
jgi:hypothetical protein